MNELLEVLEILTHLMSGVNFIDQIQDLGQPVFAERQILPAVVSHGGQFAYLPHNGFVYALFQTVQPFLKVKVFEINR